jgi:O-antigen ligase
MLSRFPFLFVCALIALVGSMTAVFAITDQRDFNLRGYENPLSTTELPFRIPRLGVNAELTQYDTDELRQQFELMQNAHIYWVRQFAYWDEIEPQQGEYNWSEWDRITVAITEFSDLSLVAVLMNSPEWSRDAGTNSASPHDPQHFADFAKAFAERYGEQIDYYQIWDEPNLTEAWGGLNPLPAEYLSLLQPAYTAIHTADETATVIAAALAPTTENGPENISDWQYLDDMYRLGAAEFMDAAAGKPYGFDTSPVERTLRSDTLNFSRVIGLREVMRHHADGKTALWASSWGWNSLPENWSGEPSIWGNVDAETRIRFSLAALDRAEREWAWLGGMVLFHWQPQAATNDPIWGFAIIDASGNPTQLYNALVERVTTLYPTEGLYSAANPYAQYSGVWTFSPLGADIGWLSDSRFKFDFYGSEVGLLLREDDYIAYLYPTINNNPTLANAVPQDASGNPYIILNSGTTLPALKTVKVADNLPLQLNTLEAIADRGDGRYALAGYAVSYGDLNTPYNAQINIAWTAALASLIASVITGWQVGWRTLLHPVILVLQRLSGVTQLLTGAFVSLILMISMVLTWGEATPNLFRRDTVQLGLSILTAGLIYLNPALPLTLIAASILFILFYNRPAFGLAFIVFYAPFFLFPVELFRFAFPMAELLTLITFASWSLCILTRWAKTRNISSTETLERNVHPLDGVVIAFVLLGSFAFFWSENRDAAFTELRTLIIEPSLFYLMFRTLPLTRQDVLRVIDALLLAGFVVCVIGIFLYLRGEGIITAEEASRRLASVYGSPNNVALFLGRALPFALVFVLIPLDRLRQVVAGVMVALMLFTVILTQSVGGLFIGVPLSVAAVLLLIYRRRAIIPLIVLALVAIVGFGVAASVSERFARAVDFTQGTNFYRIRVWQSAIHAIQDRPITGLGLDQFLNAFRDVYMLPDAEPEPELSHPHNFLLDIWVRLGIVGVFWWAAVQSLFWRNILRTINKEDKTIFALTVGVVGSMVNLLAHGMVDNSIFVLDLAFVFMLLLGLTVWFSKSNTRSIDVKDS